MLREQVVTPRTGRGAAAKGRGAGQRPSARRAGKSQAQSARSKSVFWKSLLSYVPLVSKLLLAVCLGALVFVGYRTAASAAFFQVKGVDVEGTSRVSREDVESAVVRLAGGVGVWNADLDAISRRVRELPWVRTAVVSRVLPSGLRVRITEREPRVIARTAAGRLVWVDDEGVILGSALPGENDFLVRGFDESNTERARQQNSERVAVALELGRDWASAGLIGRISEINLEDLRDVRVQLAGDDAQVEIRLGRENFVKRFHQAIEVLDAERGGERRPFITHVDVTHGSRAIVGTDPSARLQPTARTAPGETTPAEATTSDAPVAARPDAVKREAAKPKETAKAKEPARPADAARKRGATATEKKKVEKRDTALERPGGAVRPRRVS